LGWTSLRLYLSVAEYQNAQKTITQLRIHVADGKRRLSVRVKRPVCPAQNPEASALDARTDQRNTHGAIKASQTPLPW